MPKHKGPDLLEDRDLLKYDYVSFMENMALDEPRTAANNIVTGSKNGA